MWKNPLEKWTAEFLGATIIGIALWVVPMTWEIRCIGTVILWILIADLIRRTSWPKIAKFSLVFVAAVGLSLLIYPTVAADYQASLAQPVSLSQDQQANNSNNSLDNEISFSCELMAPPKSLDGNSNESVWVYILEGPPPNFAHVWGYIGLPGGSPTSEFAIVDQKPFSVLKCSITNYSNESLIGVYTTLSAYFFPLKKINNGWRVSQNPLSSEQIKTPTFNVPPATSPNNTQFFYISNPTPYFVQITIPTEVTLLDNGSTNEKTVNLIPLTELSVPGIWPGIPPTNPPTASLPTPKPQ